MSSLTKDTIAERLTKKTDLTLSQARELLETMIELIKSSLEQGTPVKISGFGNWLVREKQARPGRNPHSGERLEIAARRVVTFHPSDILRERVNAAVDQ